MAAAAARDRKTTIRVEGAVTAEITIFGGVASVETSDGEMKHESGLSETPQITGTERSSEVDEARIREYWEFSTDNSRRFFRGLAEEQIDQGSAVTFDAVGERLGVSASEARRLNRTSYRGFHLWKRRHSGEEPPIDVVQDEIAPGSTRKRTWRLPDGVAEIILSFEDEEVNDRRSS